MTDKKDLALFMTKRDRLVKLVDAKVELRGDIFSQHTVVWSVN